MSESTIHTLLKDLKEQRQRELSKVEKSKTDWKEPREYKSKDGSTLPPPPDIDIMKLPREYREQLAKLAIYQQSMIDALEEVLETMELHARYGSLAVKTGTHIQLPWLSIVDTVQDAARSQRTEKRVQQKLQSSSFAPDKPQPRNSAPLPQSAPVGRPDPWNNPWSPSATTDSSSYAAGRSASTPSAASSSNALSASAGNPWAPRGSPSSSSSLADSESRTQGWGGSSTPTATAGLSASDLAFVDMDNSRRRQEVESRWGSTAGGAGGATVRATLR